MTADEPTLVDCDGCTFGPFDAGTEARAIGLATEHANETGHPVSTYPEDHLADYHPDEPDVGRWLSSEGATDAAVAAAVEEADDA